MHDVSWRLLIGAAYTSVLIHSTRLDVLNDGDTPCLALSQHGTALPRCTNHSTFEPRDNTHEPVNCPAGTLRIKFTPAEEKPGSRLMGDHISENFSCYSLSDQDFRRSRESVSIPTEVSCFEVLGVVESVFNLGTW